MRATSAGGVSGVVAPPDADVPGDTVQRLVVAGLHKSFGTRSVLKDVSLSVGPGELVAVLGPSGAGKTTLFRCAAALLSPDKGTVSVAGARLADLRGGTRRLARRRVAVIFQQYNLVRRLSALQNVLAGRLGYVPAWRGWLRRFTREDTIFALECLERVGMLEYADQRADTLSGGQQQRVAIARALAQRPVVILADEPVSSLDPRSSESILELLRAIAHADGVAVVCNLHQVHLACEYADRLIGLAQGRIVIDIPAALVDAAAVARIYPQAEITDTQV